MNEDEALSRFGLHPSKEELKEIRVLLNEQSKLERKSQGEGDTELMKLLCVCLFNEGSIDDALLIWTAKTASIDADASIEVQLLCGRGLSETKEYLSDQASDVAAAALQRLTECEVNGDFDVFSVGEIIAEYADYYGDEEG